MTKRQWISVIAVALAARALVALVLLRSMPMVSDAASYFDFALELLSGAASSKAYYWPPGNSLVLAGLFAITGPSVAAARVLMIASSTGGVVLTALLSRELSRSPEAARRGAWIGALYAPAVLLCGQTYSQHVAAFTLAAVAYFGLLAVRRAGVGAAVAAGLAFGLGCLTRPSMASVAPVILVAWLLAFRKERAARGRLIAGALAFAVLSAVCVAPSILHNARTGGGATISTNNERNFFLGNNPYTPDYKTSHLGQRGLAELEPETRAYLESFYAQPDARSAMQHEAVQYIAHHPLVTAYRTLNRATSFWGFDYLAARIIQEDRGWGKKALLPLLAVEGGSYVLVMALALVALFAREVEQDRWVRGWLVAMALAYEAPYAIAFSGGTYHFPVMPLVIPFAAVALERGVGGVLRAMRAEWRVAVAIGVLAIVQAQYAYYAIAMAG